MTKSKFKRPWSLVFLALVLVVGPGASAEDRIAPPPPGQELEALLAEADKIDGKIGDIRTLAALGPIKKSVKTREELSALLQKKIEEEIEPDELAKETAVLVRMGLLEEGFDYAEFILNLLTEQIAGFYDNETRELVIINSGAPISEQRVVLAHELFHAIQDQHFSIDSLDAPDEGLVGASGNEDRSLARTALIEGDATAVMLDFTYYEMGAIAYGSGASLLDNPLASKLIASQLNSMDPAAMNQAPVLSSAPGWIQEMLTFPYIQGLLFVAKMRSDGNWDQLNQVYLRPPESTEHILHPERYLAGDDPILVVIDELAVASKLGAEAQHIYDNVMGELKLRLWLEHHMTPKELARMAPGLTVQMAAQGWGGDRLYGFSVDGETVVVSATVWDTARDALEFEVALASMYKLRWPEATVTTQKGEYGASHCFADGDQIHYIERWGPWVVHIEGLPGGVPFDTVRTAIWETRRVGDYPPTQTRGPGRD